MVKKLLSRVTHKIKTFNLPQPLLVSNVELTPEHKQAVLSDNQTERDWYQGVPGFASLAQILAAAATGRLIKVEPSTNYLPIMRLRNPKLMELYPPYLTVHAKALLDEVCANWRRKMDTVGYDPKIRLAITSLVRTIPYQATIVRAGKLADPDSVHTRGEVFDMDASGYYLDELPINPRAGLKQDIDKAFKDLGGGELATGDYGDFSLYQPHVHELLKEVLEVMQKEGKLHFASEFAGTSNAVFHVCRNPEYIP